MWGKPGTRLGHFNSQESIAKFKETIRNKQYGRRGSCPSIDTKELWSQQRRGRLFHGKKPLTQAEIQQIIALFDNGNGFTANEIAIKIDRCATTIRKIIRRILVHESKKVI